MYPDEKEVLLQEGLVAEVKGYEVETEDDDITILNLYISDKIV